MQGEGVYSLGELAVRFGLELRGDPALRVSHVATLARAAEGSLSFLANSRYRKHLGGTHATAVVVAPGDAHDAAGLDAGTDDRTLDGHPDAAVTAGGQVRAGGAGR